MFDWSNYLVLAEDLATRTGDEAAARTAINRAYYATFGAARRYLVSVGVAVPKSGAAHALVWTSFQNRPGRINHRIANYGRRLVIRRRQADYEELYSAAVADLPVVLYWARRVLADLATLP
jgi:uncharacterized protein (UPF0332 family)